MIVNQSDWNIETKKDLRIPTFVSLIKAAHLSMFSLFGYRYALTYAGRFIGEDILGKFYRANDEVKTKTEAARVGASDRRAQEDTRFELTSAETVAPKDVRQLGSNPLVPI
jgi:hypothetical protein